MPSANVVQTSVSGGQQNALALQGDGVFLPKLSTATRTALTLGTSDKGFLAYDTTDNNVYIWNGAAWESVPASGDSSNTQVIFNDNGTLAGDAGLTYDKATDSLTITGDLTVDTNTLKVNSSANRVGVLTASPESELDVRGLIAVRGTPTFPSTGVGIESYYSAANTSSFIQSYDRGGGAFANLSYSALAHIWQINGGESMRLNSTGLGVGGAPLSGFRLNVNNGDFRVSDVQNEDGVEIGWSAGAGSGFVQVYNRTTSAFKDLVLNNAATITASGNVGIGVVPSALTNVTRLEIGGQLSSNVTLRSTSTSASARNWMVAANAVSFGDFVIRQGNSQGAEPNSGTDRLYIDPSGNLILQSSATPATLTTNGQLTVNATSNTNLRFSYRGSDGVTRVANITLA